MEERTCEGGKQELKKRIKEGRKEGYQQTMKDDKCTNHSNDEVEVNSHGDQKTLLIEHHDTTSQRKSNGRTETYGRTGERTGHRDGRTWTDIGWAGGRT